MPNELHGVILDLAGTVVPPEEGILSRTVYQDDTIKAVVFGFGAGQSLSEHTSARPTTLQIVSGKATITLGEDEVLGQPGTWIHMPPGLVHAVRAEEPTVMLLLIQKSPGVAPGS